MTEREDALELEAKLSDFNAIVERYSDFVYNVSAYRAFERFRGESRITTWLYRITVNAALMRLRKENRPRTLTRTGLDDVEASDWQETPERSVIMSELGVKLQEGISSLEPDLRAVVVLRDVSGLSNSEAADVLGITVSSLKSRLHRGRVLLRQYLADYLESTR